LSCENGHFEVAKWLWEISDHEINIHSGDECAFRLSYMERQLEVVKWLWKISRTIEYDFTSEHKELVKKIVYDDRKPIINYREHMRSLK
jgi:hypothetical protein